MGSFAVSGDSQGVMVAGAVQGRPSCSRAVSAQRSCRYRGGQSGRGGGPARHHPPWPPPAFLAFPLSPGRTLFIMHPLPHPTPNSDPAKAATDTAAPIPWLGRGLLSGEAWPRYPGRGGVGWRPARRTVLRVSLHFKKQHLWYVRGRSGLPPPRQHDKVRDASEQSRPPLAPDASRWLLEGGPGPVLTDSSSG